MRPKLPSIQTVARHAGVSIATVSNVLGGRRAVAPELAARVRAAVEELGYIADGAASRLRSRQSRIVGVVVPTLANPFFGSLVAALEVAARADGYDLLVASSADDPVQEAARLRALLAWRPAGLIITPCDDEFAARALAVSAGVPVVVADRVPEAPGFDVVAVDNAAAAATIGRHLVEAGRRRILLVASAFSIGNVRERAAALRREVAGTGVELEVTEVGHDLAEARAALDQRLRCAPLPDAVFALTNILTLAAFGAITARGLAIPQALALVGFDDDAWMQAVTPAVSAVDQPVGALAAAAWARLVARMAGDATPPLEVRLPCRVEFRASSRAEAAPAGPGLCAA
ncbi:MAG TPA: LacI family DNA-binding transcriptional regulator [Acetobacteraceae bacterium]|nr:LacI family DNA-binding transcriptional regulator [Acetobacteraceae bacterium]